VFLCEDKLQQALQGLFGNIVFTWHDERQNITQAVFLIHLSAKGVESLHVAAKLAAVA